MALSPTNSLLCMYSTTSELFVERLSMSSLQRILGIGIKFVSLKKSEWWVGNRDCIPLPMECHECRVGVVGWCVRVTQACEDCRTRKLKTRMVGKLGDRDVQMECQ